MSMTTAHFYSWGVESARGTVPDDIDHDEANNYSFAFLDPSTDYTIDWGDGSTDTTFTSGTDGTSGNKAHTYANAGIFDIVVTNDTTAQVVARDQAVVLGVVTSSPVKLVPSNVVMTELAAAEDYRIDFGDGTSDTFTSDGSGEYTFTHVYATTGVKTVVVVLDSTPDVTIATADVTVAAFVSVVDAFTDTNSTALASHAFTGTGVGGWTAQGASFDIQTNKASSLAVVGAETALGPVNGLVQAVVSAPLDGVGIVARWIDANTYIFLGQRDDVSAVNWVGREVRASTATISNVALTTNVATITATAHGFKHGDTVVVDASNNTFDGTYVVLARNEQQTITVNATGGNFTITFAGQTTAAINANETAANVKLALELLSNVELDDIAVARSGSVNAYVYTLTFQGQYAATDVGAVTTAAGALTGGTGTAAVATTVVGVGVTANTFSYAKTNADIPSAAATGTAVGHVNVQTKSTGSAVTAGDTLKITFVDGVATFFVNGTNKGTFTNSLNAEFIATQDTGPTKHGIINEKGTASATLDDFTIATL